MLEWVDRTIEAVDELKKLCPHEFLLRLRCASYNCFRYANSRGTQNTSIESLGLSLVVAARDGRLNGDACNGARMVGLDSSAFEPVELMRRALARIDGAPLNKEYKGFASPGLVYTWTQAYHPCTASLDSTAKATELEALRRKNPDYWLGGIWESSTSLRVLASSEGLLLFSPATEFNFELKAMRGDRSASVLRNGRKTSSFHLESAAETALAALSSETEDAELPDGEYDCLFGPEAVSELCFFTSLLGFGGRGDKQGTNFTSGKIGERLFENDLIVLRDDCTDVRGLCTAFDDWGYPRKPITLIDRGRACQVAHDMFTAPSEDAITGHGDGSSPFPMLMVLEGGNTPLQELLEMGGPCLRISRFHYPTVADPDKPLIKGSTKDGTYLADGGKSRYTGPKEFLFNPVSVFAAASALSREQVTVRQGSLAMSRPGSNVVPWMLVRGMKVTDGVLTLL